MAQGKKILINIGEIYGTYQVLEENKNIVSPYVYWKVKCIYCGEEKNKRGIDLNKGKCIICKCQQKLDIIGKVFGDVTVIEKTDKHSSDNSIIYKCKCNHCGFIQEFAATRLRRDEIFCQQCHERKSTVKDLTNQIFGNLKVLYQDKEKIRTSHGQGAYWICECLNCGSIISTRGADLISRNTSSCGCIKSKGEFTIAKILTENNINFKREFKFLDLKDKGYLKFDFAIFDDSDNLLYLIEYDGIQHFKANERGWNTTEHLLNIQRRDRLKDEYCQNNNIPLIRIKYNDKITTEKVLLREVM